MSRTLHVISHSHWDREWHLTFQQFRLRLVRLIDDVLDLMREGDAFPYFMLDGQTIVLEDYAEIRPERIGELRQHIQAGRILIGPWYVHPDEFLVSGEAMVRNLLLGARLCAEWGGYMAVGYAPDQFGHIAQLPQIWRGFGIDNTVVWRGVEHAVARLAFTWRAPDGSEVYAAVLPNGYNTAERLPAGAQATAERLRALVQAQEPLATSNSPILIMNGGDHTGVQSDVPAALAGARHLLEGDFEVVHGTLPAYIAESRNVEPAATVLEGELRSSRDVFLLPAVTSARMWIKQRNAAAQRLLERYAEPLACAALALGHAYPGGELRQSWRYLLQNHPHDSICGCSVDQVHHEMVTRFDWSEQIAAAAGDEALARLAAAIDSVLPGAEDPHTLAITVFNGASAAHNGIVEVPVHLVGEASSYELLDQTGAPVPHAWLGEHGESPTQVELPREEVPDLATIMAQVEGNRVFGLGIAEVSMRTLGDALHVEVTTSDQAILTRDELEAAVRDAFALAESAGSARAVATIHRGLETVLAAHVEAVPALGYKTLLLRPRPKGGSATAPHTGAPELLPIIQNERYRVEADPAGGVLTITERGSGQVFGPMHVFVDEGDTGDLYTYCAPPNDSVVSSAASPATITRETGPLGETLRIRHTLHVPTALAESRWERDQALVELAIESAVTLAPGDTLIRFQTTVENAAADHRLRVHMALPFKADHAHADDAFAIVRRAAQPDAGGDWAEQPVGTAPHQGVVAVHGGGHSCLLAAQGLPEYEVLERTAATSELALTLLRCTGWLSRGDIPTRPGEAGPSLPTPEAQCPGRYSFSYALALGPEPWRALLPAARAFATPLRAHIGTCAEGRLPASASLVTAQPAAIVVSALKGAEDGRGIVLRLFNDDTAPHAAELGWLFPVRKVTRLDLAERDGEVLHDGAPVTELAMEIAAGRIVTLRLEL